MNFVSIILNAAKAANVSGMLLLAICSHESNDFRTNYSKYDNGSPSYGVCQVKEGTARQMGFKGNAERLKDPRISAIYAAKYLKYQETQYGNNWVFLAAAYNSGTYNPSNRVPGCPRNLRYIKLVQRKLPSELKGKLQCGGKQVADNKGNN